MADEEGHHREPQEQDESFGRQIIDSGLAPAHRELSNEVRGPDAQERHDGQGHGLREHALPLIAYSPGVGEDLRV